MAMKILVIEDEPGIRDNILYALEADGFSASWKGTGNEALEEIKANSPDLLVLDIGLPDINGFELCRQVRAFSEVPIIFLTARSEEIDRVAGLEMGADDYITKPFSPREVVARVRAVLRRMKPATPKAAVATESAVTSNGLYSIDTNRMLISVSGNALDLSRYEFGILELFINHPGRVYTRDDIMNLVWDEPEISCDRTVDTHIKRIRHKIKAINNDLDPIVTRRGVGYSFSEEL